MYNNDSKENLQLSNVQLRNKLGLSNKLIPLKSVSKNLQSENCVFKKTSSLKEQYANFVSQIIVFLKETQLSIENSKSEFVINTSSNTVPVMSESFNSTFTRLVSIKLECMKLEFLKLENLISNLFIFIL